MATFEQLRDLLSKSESDAGAYSAAKAAAVASGDNLTKVTADANAAVKAASDDVQAKSAAESAARDTLDQDRASAHTLVDDLFLTLTSPPAPPAEPAPEPPAEPVAEAPVAETPAEPSA